MIHIIGGGLAGSEAAWQAASLGVEVLKLVRVGQFDGGGLLHLLVAVGIGVVDDEQEAVLADDLLYEAPAGSQLWPDEVI